MFPDDISERRRRRKRRRQRRRDSSCKGVPEKEQAGGGVDTAAK